MEIRVDKLRKNLALLQPVVPRNPSLKVLTNVLFRDGAIRATDLEVEVSIAMPEIAGDAFLLPYRQAMEVLKFVPGDLVLSITPQDKSVKLSWTGGSAAYPVPLYNDFPDSALHAPESEAIVNGDVLTGAMMDALHYVKTGTETNTVPGKKRGSRTVKSKDAGVGVLSGVGVMLDEHVQICGADGYRASYESTRLSWPVKQTIIVPPDTVGILDLLWHKEPGKPALSNDFIAQITAARPLKLGIWEGRMSAQFADITLVSTLITGTYPDVLALLNGFKEPIKVKFFGPDLETAARRLAAVAKESTEITYLVWNEAAMTVSAQSAEVGEVSAEITVLEGSQPGRIALKCSYLLDYLAGKTGLITMGNAGQDSPALFHYGSRPIVAIMPMKAIWGDEPVEEAKAQEAPAAAAEEAPSTAENTEPEAVNEEETGEPGDEPEEVEETDAETVNNPEPAAVGPESEE